MRKLSPRNHRYWEVGEVLRGGAWWEVLIDHYIGALSPGKISNSQQRAREKRAQVTSNHSYFSRRLKQGATLTMAALWRLDFEAQLQTLKLFLQKGSPCFQTSNTMLTNNEKTKQDKQAYDGLVWVILAGSEFGQSTVVWYVAPRRPGQKNIGSECESPIKEVRGLKPTFLYYLENG